MLGYMVSNKGNVKSYRRDKVSGIILRQRYDKDGYIYSGSLRVHRAVAKTFIENPNNYPVVNHIDGNKQNNDVDNLEWCTISHNTQHGYDIGLSYSAMSKSISLSHNGELLSVYNSCSECSKELGISRGNVENALSEYTKIFDELTVSYLGGKQSEHEYYKKVFFKRLMKIYNSKPIEYRGLTYESIRELSESIGVSYQTLYWSLANNKPHNGHYITRLTRYEYITT